MAITYISPTITLVKKPEDPVLVASRQTAEAIGSIKAEVATVAARVDALGDKLAAQQEKHSTDLKARLAQAMQKRPLTFDIQ